MTLSSLISGAAWTLCRLLPVKKNKVVFSHFYGKGFGDSPKAIALALRDAAPGADIVWLISDPSVARRWGSARLPTPPSPDLSSFHRQSLGG